MNKIEAIDWQRAQIQARVEELGKEIARLVERDNHLEAQRRYSLSDAKTRVEGSMSCTGCGADVSTERLFSEHFVIPDPQYYNLGYCPNKAASPTT